jgi:hypothetical protein
MNSYTVIEQRDIGEHYIVKFRGTYSSENKAMIQIVNLKKNEIYDHIHFFINCLLKKDDNFVYYYQVLNSFLDKPEDLNNVIENEFKYKIIKTEIDNPLDINIHCVKLCIQNIDLSIIQKVLNQEDLIKCYKEKKIIDLPYEDYELKSIHIDKT